MNSERRVLESKLTLRSIGGVPKLIGYAAVFNRDSDLIEGQFIERIAPGAFAESIAKAADVRALVNHEPTLILGRTVSGTLQLREDAHGLHSTISPPKTSYAQDILESTRRGDVSQMSFGFQTIRDRWEHGRHGAPDVRTLLEVRLFDVSVVTFPAYPDTDVAVRSHAHFVGGHISADSSPYDPDQMLLRYLRLLNEDAVVPFTSAGLSLDCASRERRFDVVVRQIRVDGELCRQRMQLDRLLWEPSERQHARQSLYEYLCERS